MAFLKTFSTLLRKYIFARIILLVVLFAAAIVVSTFVNKKTLKIPKIHSIDPSIGSPGDIMIIKGENFGVVRNSSYVEIGNSKISSTGYMSWSDKQIKIVLPSNVQDGLVIVGTADGRSSAVFFANEISIPVAVPPDTYSSLPQISSIAPEKATFGGVVTILGNNFGSVQGSSTVCFAANRDVTESSSKNANESAGKIMNVSMIPAMAENFDYEYWSDSEIRVRVPDGAASGAVYITTEKGESNNIPLEVESPIGSRNYSGRTTYLIQSASDIASSPGAKSNCILTVRIPRPITSAQQPFTELTATIPQPMILDYQNTVIYQGEIGRSAAKKLRFSQDFVISVYNVTTTVDEKKVKPFSEKTSRLYIANTKSDKLIPSSNPEIVALSKNIVAKETNPYKRAKLAYNYFLENFEILNAVRTGNASAIDILDSKKGDAYDFSIVYSAILRSLGIPCVSVAGILVDSEMTTQSHWWNEFYIEGFGWIPVDVSLGKGLDYKGFRSAFIVNGEEGDKKDFYFGNLDAQHIAFSRGWNEIKASSTNSKVLYRPRTYAFQSVWEESTSESVNYSSLWNTPSVLGVY